MRVSPDSSSTAAPFSGPRKLTRTEKSGAASTSKCCGTPVLMMQTSRTPKKQSLNSKLVNAHDSVVNLQEPTSPQASRSLFLFHQQPACQLVLVRRVSAISCIGASRRNAKSRRRCNASLWNEPVFSVSQDTFLLKPDTDNFLSFCAMNILLEVWKKETKRTRQKPCELFRHARFYRSFPHHLTAHWPPNANVRVGCSLAPKRGKPVI
jgi:hypothetical protein